MKAKAVQIRNAIFWSLVAIFAVMVFVIGHRGWWAFISVAAVFVVLAAVLVVLTVKLKESGARKFFFILTGISAMGIPICIILHNLVYFLCIKFGWAFQGEGEDEPVFFILAILVFPALYVIGSLGSIVLLVSARLKKKNPNFPIFLEFRIWNWLFKRSLKKKTG